jgi:hypothetical protein
MTLFFIIIVSLLLTLILLLTFIYFNFSSIKEGIKFMFLTNDDLYSTYNFAMSLMLFLVLFITTSATYNTFIDKNNPNYYKNE